MDIKAADIDFKIQFINNGSLKNTGYKIRTWKNTVYLQTKDGGEIEVILHSKKEVYKFLYRFDSFLVLIPDQGLITTVFKNCD